ncbi:SH3 domain-containing protein [Fulvivirga sediminis]|uniref:SH3 domain-containing protein n=1 Tax=Fulvivirga sediminis TaxID=2803949 RepID=A0A937FDX0_9BACT|nr:SH3 domain-containing protein [Fulvivirga sediminis]MBL3658623.1 hypothetical protein [Fulvivirga sediminis]
MKFFKLLFLCSAMGLLTYCSSSNESEESSTESENLSNEEAPAAKATEAPAVCVWDNISVRKEASSKSKWLTSISLGESLTSLGNTEKDSLDNDREYTQIQLADGTEGWALSDFIIENAKVGVFLEDVFIYKRPDLLTKTDKKFTQMDIVAIKSTEGDWLEVVGKRTGAKWIQNGWVKKANISEKDIDVAVAKFAKPALNLSNDSKKVAALEEIVGNSDLSSSSFISVINRKLDELSQDDEMYEEYAEDTDYESVEETEEL